MLGRIWYWVAAIIRIQLEKQKLSKMCMCMHVCVYLTTILYINILYTVVYRELTYVVVQAG